MPSIMRTKGTTAAGLGREERRRNTCVTEHSCAKVTQKNRYPNTIRAEWTETDDGFPNMIREQ